MVTETSCPRIERRRHSRIHLQAPTIMVSSGDVRIFSLENIGTGGAFLKGDPAPEVGTEVRIEFTVGRGRYLSLSGIVVRQDPAARGFAVRFKLTHDERERLAHALSEAP